MSALNSSAIADDSSDEDSLIASLSVLPTPAPGPFNKGRVNSGGGSIGSFRLHQRRESNANLDAVHDLRASTEISPHSCISQTLATFFTLARYALC